MLRHEIFKLVPGLNSKLSPIPCSMFEYSQWQDELPEAEKSLLGKILRKDSIDDTTVITTFLHSPCGLFNTSLRLFLTQRISAVSYSESAYSSYRAAMDGHNDSLRKLRKPDLKVMSEGA